MSVAELLWKPLGILTVVAMLVGCNDSVTTVTGSVTYNGEPVKNGYISFQPSDGTGKSFATPVADGTYIANKAFPGNKTVVVTGIRDITFYGSSSESYQKAEEAKQAGKLADVAEAVDYIAPDAEGNSKQVEILPGDQTMDFSITGDPVQ